MMKEILSISVLDEARSEFDKRVYTLLATYSNAHLGSGHNSIVTSRMYDQAWVRFTRMLRITSDHFLISHYANKTVTI